MSTTLTKEYARVLRSLEGSEFQAEVSARMAAVVAGFQTIPAKPSGDAGLDGLSHNGTHAYCCYGMEHDGFHDSASRERAVVRKFSSDLRRLFELEMKDGDLVHKNNPELSTILASDQKLVHIDLVSNWFESHRVIGRLMTRLNAYKEVSSCRYVNPNVTVTIVGPDDLANRHAVDQVAIARATARGFVDRVHESAREVDVADPMDFDVKMDILRQLVPDQRSAVDAIAKGLRADWRTALAFERELVETVPDLHRALEIARGQIVRRVSELMITGEHPWTQLPNAQRLSHDILDRDFGTLYGSIVTEVSSGEIARLIGECPVGWQSAGEEQ